MTQSKSVTTVEPLVKGKEEEMKKKYERDVISTQKTRSFPEKMKQSESFWLQSLTLHLNGWTIWPLSNIWEHIWGRHSPAIRCTCEQTDVETSVSPVLLWTAFARGFAANIANAFNVGDFHASLGLHGNSRPESNYICVRRNIAQVHKIWLRPMRACAALTQAVFMCRSSVLSYVRTFADFSVCLC